MELQIRTRNWTGSFVFAISGFALQFEKREHDLFWKAGFTGFITAIGGGTLARYFIGQLSASLD